VDSDFLDLEHLPSELAAHVADGFYTTVRTIKESLEEVPA